MKNLKTRIHLPEVVGKGYGAYWNYKGRYRVLKGSRASKKSTTTALNMIWRIMKYPDSNGLVVRKVFATLKDSCYAQLKWAIRKLGVEKHWQEKMSPLELIYKPTGQKILFRGLDDPYKIGSVTVEVGHLTFVWIEEAYEIMDRDDFQMIDESIRGKVPEHLFKQMTLTFNPWSDKHWLKEFYDSKDDDTLAMTTTYKINEWLDESDKKMFERMKKNNPKRYKVAGEGDWGIIDGVIYENWKEQIFSHKEKEGIYVNGLDFGFTNDPTALVQGKLGLNSMVLYVYDELYKKGMTTEAIDRELKKRELQNEIIIADNEPRTIARLRTLGNEGVKGAVKGPDSVNAGIDFLQDFFIVVHPKCVNFITEISNYVWEADKTGKKLNIPTGDMNHLMDAMRYALEKYIVGNGWIY